MCSSWQSAATLVNINVVMLAVTMRSFMMISRRLPISARGIVAATEAGGEGQERLLAGQAIDAPISRSARDVHPSTKSNKPNPCWRPEPPLLRN
jgi:hypothetical protein